MQTIITIIFGVLRAFVRGGVYKDSLLTDDDLGTPLIFNLDKYLDLQNISEIYKKCVSGDISVM